MAIVAKRAYCICTDRSSQPREKIKSMVGENRLIQPIEIAKVIYFVATNPVTNDGVFHVNLGQRQS